MGDAEESNRFQRYDRVLVDLATSEEVRSGDLDAVLARVTAAAAETLGVARVGVWLFDAPRARITCRMLFERGRGARIDGTSVDVTAYPTYVGSLSRDRVLAADDARADVRTCGLSATYLEPLGIASMMDAPIRRRGVLAGVLCHEHVGAPRHWTLDEQLFAASLGDLVALALEPAPASTDSPTRVESRRVGSQPSAAPSLPPPAVLADLSAPDAFGEWLLLESLGGGGMGDVFVAVRRSEDGAPEEPPHLAAIKRLRSAHEQDPRLVDMFLDEARLCARLRHPNVVATLGVGEVRGAPFIAMELVDGQTVQRLRSLARTRDAVVPPEVWASIVAQALRGLHHAHEAVDERGEALELVHRDVSPRNLMVTYDGVAKVVDFGIARAKTNLVRTETGELKGTLAYMAPEQVLGVAPDRRADVYAAGAILWELLAGKRFREGGGVEAVLAAASTDAPPLASVQPAADPGLAAVVDRALARTPAARWPTASAMADALDAVAGGDRTRDVAAVVGALFAAERRRLHVVLDERLAALRAQKDEPTS